MTARLGKCGQGVATFKTVLKRIALADGKLSNHEYYMTKYQMIALAKAVLKVRKP